MNEVRVTVRVAPVDCWSCGAEFKIVPSIEFVANGSKLECCVSDFTDYPELISEVHANLPADAEIGQLKSRYSKTWARYYTSNGCYHCDALYGQHYEIHARYDEKDAVSFESAAANKWRAMIEAIEASEDGHLIRLTSPTLLTIKGRNRSLDS
jgi:competence protein CoiA